MAERIDTAAWWGDPGRMWREMKAAMAKTEAHIAPVLPMIKKYHGKYFRTDVAVADAALENDYADWTSYITPRSAYNAPRVRIGSVRSERSVGRIAKVLELAMNRWIKDRNLQVLLSWLLVDMQFAHGVMLTSQQGIPGARPMEGLDPEEPDVPGIPHSPYPYRLSPDCYHDDALARQPDEVRFRGRVCFALREELLARAHAFPDQGWSLAEIQALPKGIAKELLQQNDVDVDTGRDLVCWSEEWVPEAEFEGGGPVRGWRAWGFHGLTLTLPVETPNGSSPSSWLRKPRPYYGPMEGPFTLFGVHFVPGSTRHLSPLAVAEEQIKDANAHARSLSESAKDYKRFIVVDKTDPRIQNAIANIGHHGILPLVGFSKDKMQEAEVGGITDQQIAYSAIARDRVNRTLHLDTPSRGSIEGRGTATEVDRAAGASETRVEWVDLQFKLGTVAGLKNALHFIYHDNRTVIELDQEAFEELGIDPNKVRRLRYQGGITAQDVPLAALELDVEPFSQRLMDSGYSAQVVSAMEWLVGTMPMMVQFPEAKWPEIAKHVGVAFQVPDLAELVDWKEMQRHAQQLQAQMGASVMGAQTPASTQRSPGHLLNSRGQNYAQLGQARPQQARPGGPGGGGAKADVRAPRAGMVSSRGPAAASGRALGRLPGAGRSNRSLGTSSTTKEKS